MYHLYSDASIEQCAPSCRNNGIIDSRKVEPSICQVGFLWDGCIGVQLLNLYFHFVV